MEELLQATIAGLVIASILAVAASGLVLTYTTTGIFNFAHGALGMLGAFAYWQLRFEWEWPAPVALLVVLGVLAPLVGVVIERGIMRGLADAPETARVVVTISLLMALLGLGWVLWSPEDSHPVERFWSDSEPRRIFDVAVTYHEMAAFAIAVLLAIGLRLFLYNTRTGVAMRAAVDDRSLASLNGSRPARSAMIAWGIGCACAALSGILMAPLTGLRHIDLTLLIVNAYAAAIIGRLRSLPLTFLGALMLGLADRYVLEFAPSGSPLWTQFRFALPAVALFVVLLALRPVALVRSHSVARAREAIFKPRWTGSVVTALCFVLVAVYVANTFDSSTDLLRMSRVLALAIIALSLVPLVGFGGQLSLCQMSFAGLGAIAAANWGGGGTPAGLLYAALFAGAVGAVVAIPAIRLGGLYLALATAAFAVMLDRWIFTLDELSIGPFDVTLFPASRTSVDRLEVPGTDVTDTPEGLLIVMSVVFALFYLLVVFIRRSTFGQRLLAMKSSPQAAATVGMNLTVTKFAVFTLSAAMAGVGGALYAGAASGAVQPDAFAFITSLPLLLLAVVGGIAAASGALFAGVVLGTTPLLIDAFSWLEKLSLVLPGLMGIALGRNPNGATEQIRAGFAPLKHNRPALALTVCSTLAVLGLRLADVVNGYPYALALIAAGLSGSLLLRARELLAAPQPGDDVAVSDDGHDDVSLEWLGIERPFTTEDAVAIERQIGLDLLGAERREEVG
jgi:branched-chain amino acid transport system permease protein